MKTLLAAIVLLAGYVALVAVYAWDCIISPLWRTGHDGKSQSEQTNGEL